MSWPHDTQVVTKPPEGRDSLMKTCASCLQRGHRTGPGSAGFITISESQVRHLKDTLGVMIKRSTVAVMTLAVILLTALPGHAQTVAGIARQERERRTQVKST